MSESKSKFRIHLIRSDTKSGKLVKQYVANHAPRIGDEIRISDSEFYEVTHCVWCLDEDSPFTRINIGIKKAK